MKVLEKDRTRRYGSPSDLSADIGRHLRDEPVVAGPRQLYRAILERIRRFAATPPRAAPA